MAAHGFSHTEKRTINKLVLDNDDAKVPPPQCEHGPAVRFRRITKAADGSVQDSRDFYACSAIRDRKICPLFCWVDEYERHAENSAKRLRTSGPEREYDKTNNKANAQYFFSGEAVGVIKRYVAKHGYHRVLCLGTPVVYRTLSDSKDNVDTFLLDMDPVVVQKAESSGARFNMVNGYFFDDAGKDRNEGWLRSGGVDIVVVDPPFQPELVPAIWRSLRSLLGSDAFSKVDVLFAFPYFSRDALQESPCAPKLFMNEYRVDYANHKTYKADRSPVRFFTRLHELTNLPSSSYKVCKKCGGKWVHNSNVHCDLCGGCMTIHGAKAWEHCSRCGKCTKPGLKHCDNCTICLPVGHQCRSC
ncbi:rRNA N6-adenosine-methyltransferase zcchc4 [Perkinsus chesapeaki]|uniref:rRNA N(6)-adenosine-methyltransferase ZCCHC4 n=1 Tax=Perkinsus chesapeaki TaxID=330153 RepID=A0A7J6N2F3_PERCH|nr:rRNA N6-adenosine-methyltransferase zcchc4 [Perkinsus chesapeaki]